MGRSKRRSDRKSVSVNEIAAGVEQIISVQQMIEDLDRAQKQLNDYVACTTFSRLNGYDTPIRRRTLTINQATQDRIKIN